MTDITKSAQIDLVELNFDRYEAQLHKIAKGNQLQTFAMNTMEQELNRIKNIVSIAH